MDKISYALGLGIGQQIKSMNIENFSIEDFTKSISDVIEGKETAFSSREAQMMLQEYFTRKQKEEAQAHIAEGKAYLDANAKRQGVVVTKSGLQYEVLQEGKGSKPNKRKRVKMNFELRLTNGKVVESHWGKDVMELPVANVIPGLQNALTLMPEGSTWEIYIPWQLGYGAEGSKNIPPYSALIFKVKLLEVVKLK